MSLPKDPIKNKEWRRKRSEATRGEKNPNYGKIMSEEQREKIAEARRGKKHPISKETRRKIAESNRGHAVSEETRKKISEAMRGKVLSEEHCKKLSDARRGEKHPLYGKHHSEETRRKMSKALCGKYGEKSANWKGGISFEPYCPKFNNNFKYRVRAFFGYRCLECGMTEEENGKALSVHHVNYDKMVCCNDVKPLFVALCSSHNSKANSNRGYHEQHYTTIINEKFDGRCYLPAGDYSFILVCPFRRVR